MITLGKLGIIAALIAASLPAAAHHGVNAQFDMSKSFEASGTITRISLVNPHSYVYFDAKDAAGDTVNMRCELLSGSLLKRRGWSKDMFEIGSLITVTGSPDRADPTTCIMKQITFENGLIATEETRFEDDGDIIAPKRELTREDGTLNIAGNWALIHDEDNPPDRSSRPTASLTQAALAAVSEADPADNPRFNCKATNAVFDWTFNGMVNAVAQTDTDITLTYGFMDLVRTIHLDGAQMPEGFTPSRAGYSAGDWEGDTLVVTTTGFDEGWIMAPLGGRAGLQIGGAGTDGMSRPDRPNRPEGRPERPAGAESPAGGRRGSGPQPVKNSHDLTLTERFTLSKDGTVLTREYAFIDPVNLTEPFADSDTVTLTPDAYQPYDCEDLTNERME